MPLSWWFWSMARPISASARICSMSMRLIASSRFCASDAILDWKSSWVFSRVAAIWSAFSNLFYLPSVALMFIVEGLIRRLVLPPEERHGIVESIRAYAASTRSGNPIRQ